MAARHDGPGHDDVTISLTEATPDGGRLHQSWTVCGCSLAGLRAQLGPPQSESLASRAGFEATVQAILGVPGVTHTGEGL